MAISDAVIYNDITVLITSRENKSDTRFRYTMEIITPEGAITARKVHVFDITRDFISNYSDIITTAVSVSRLEYDKYLYPYREQLTARVTVEGVGDKTGIVGGEKATKLYRFKLSNNYDNRIMYGDSPGADDVAKAQELMDIGAQLFDLTLERLRLKDISGVARVTNVSDLLYVTMSDSGSIPIELHPADNTQRLNQLIIPDGTRLIDFPMWLQKYGTGVYEHNLGLYSYNDWLYIYPLFNMKRYPNRRKCIICSVGPGQMDGLDKTYKVELTPFIDPTYRVHNHRVDIISTGKVTIEDTTEKLEYEYGSAVRFTKPNFMSDAITHSNGVTTATGAGYYAHGVNKDTANNSTVHNLITDNQFYEVSRVASNRGVRATLPWENANPSLILPNTEVTVLYKSGETVSSYQGLIIGADYKVQALDDGAVKGTHTCNAVLHLILNKNPI